jgi:predicted transcriptional regulator
MSESDSRKALERLGLSTFEINAYFGIVGKGICVASEIAKKGGAPESEAQNICKKLVERGLLKEIPGRTVRYQAIPPYSALLKQLEEFREFITDLRQKMPKQLADEFDSFEKGFARVSGLGDFKDFVMSVQNDIPKAMISRLELFSQKFQSFQQLEEFKTYISKLRQSAPQEMSARFATLEGQFDKLSKMDEFRNFVGQIKTKATTELTTRFATIETGFSEMKKLDEITSRFKEIREKVPDQLRSSFGNFQNEFRKVAGLEGFKEFVGTVKSALPQKIEMEFNQIEKQFSQLQQLQEFSVFVNRISTSVPQQTLKEFEKFEVEFRKVSGLEELKAFMKQIRENIPKELAARFAKFEETLKGIKKELLIVNKDLYGNWYRIFGDIFEEFINSFVQDVVSGQLEKIKNLFKTEVINGVEEVLGKVMIRTDSMSSEIMQSFNKLRSWMVQEVISGLTATLQSVNQKVAQASQGVTQGFGQLKQWITTQVTGDLQRTLSEVEQGATNASREVIERIATLQQWFDNSVVAQLTTILTGMEQKLSKSVQDAQRELQNVKGWFVKDAIAGISSTLDATQRSVEQVSVEVNTALGKLKSWFAGEAVNQLALALSDVEARVGKASTDVVKGFAEMRNWVANDVVKTIEVTLSDVTTKVSHASEAINEEVKNLREMFSSRVVNNTFNMLSGIEDRLWESEATMKAFWDKAIAEVSFRFQEVWFVQGPDAMIGEIALICERVKSKIFIVAPRLEDVDVVPLRLIPDKVNIRIAALIDPSSQKAMDILKEFVRKENVRFRSYEGENIWGVSKDFEELILGAVSGEGLDVAGIGSIIDEHIKNFNPVLEHAWMEGKEVRSIEEAKLMKVAPKPKTIQPIAVAAGAPSISSQRSPQQIMGAVKNLGDKVIAHNITKVAEDIGSSTLSGIQGAIEKSKENMKVELRAKLGELQNNVTALNKETIADLLNELKEYIVQKYGFSRMVFDISRISRQYKIKGKEMLSAQEIKELDASIKDWTA